MESLSKAWVVMAIATASCTKPTPGNDASRAPVVAPADRENATPLPTAPVLAAPTAPNGFVLKTTILAGMKLSYAVPHDWVESPSFPGSYKPPTKSHPEYETSFRIDYQQQQEGQQSDWKGVVDRLVHTHIPFDGAHDEPLPNNGRIRWASTTNRSEAYIVGVWYNESAKKFVLCSVSLGPEHTPAVDAFVKACSSMRIE